MTGAEAPGLSRPHAGSRRPEPIARG